MPADSATQSSDIEFPYQDFTNWLQSNRHPDLDHDPGYQAWLRKDVVAVCGAAEAAEGFMPIWKMSASTDATAGWRVVLQSALKDKVWALSLAKAWPVKLCACDTVDP